MGYLVMYLPQGAVVLGDEVGQNAYNRDHGLPHIAKDGKRVTAEDIRREDKAGLGA